MEKETRQKVQFSTMAIILIVIFCIGISPKILQNDTFYTIKIGEYILENGVTMTEQFAWHQNLEYTFPHWGYDVLVFLVYKLWGMLGIYISTIALASILGITMYVVNVKLAKNRVLSFMLTILALWLLSPYICARAQLVTFILFILTIYFIEKFLDTKKIRYAIPLIIIPILIANLHVATFYFYFILYLPYIAEYMIYILVYSNVIVSGSIIEMLKRKIEKTGETEELKEKLQREEERYKKLKDKQDMKLKNPYKIVMENRNGIRWLVLIFIICLFTGLLTPLKSVPYTYLIKTMKGISTKNISEHLPLTLANDFKTLILLMSVIFITGFTKAKVRLSDLFMFLGLTILALFSRRQVSMLVLIGFVILNRELTGVLTAYKGNILKKAESILSTIPAIIGISIIVVSISIWQFNKKKDDPYIDPASYPVDAATWINENLDVEQIKLYNEYNFGSYLIYQNIPVFVDSRCDLYLPEFNKDVYVFKDFLNLSGFNLSYDGMREKIDNYGFTHFLVTNGSRFRHYLDFHPGEFRIIYPTEDAKDSNFTIYERIK